jgi:hypothetical protein
MCDAGITRLIAASIDGVPIVEMSAKEIPAKLSSFETIGLVSSIVADTSAPIDRGPADRPVGLFVVV